MMQLPRTCTVCGRRGVDGRSRCSLHLDGIGRAAVCRVCGALTEGQPYCSLHTLTEAERQARQRYRAGYDAHYRRNRRLRFELADRRCERCGADLKAGWECHHVIPLSEEGTNALENLRVTCGGGCHPKGKRARRERRQT